MVPVGTNRAASFPKNLAALRSRSFTVGSSPNTSSPSGASIIAIDISAVGLVTVSDRKSAYRTPTRRGGSAGFPPLPLDSAATRTDGSAETAANRGSG